ncbi:MAG: hypothetical protein HC824_21050 [Synechococcales cyanobacterium RM1_1_8]|nr:hypothetical protein [Synechococcales cyanobacterium RM1_1_8]
MNMPHYPQIVLKFDYQGWNVEIEQDDEDGVITYSAWANSEHSSVVAVPCARSCKEAIARSKHWVQIRLQQA